MDKHNRASRSRANTARTHAHRARRKSAYGRAPKAIDRVELDTEARETPREATRRRREAGKMVDPKVRRMRRRRITIAVLSVLLIGLVGTAVGGYLYYKSIDTKIHPISNADSEWEKILGSEPPPPGEPFYMVLMGSDTRKGEKQQRSDSLIVARVDPKTRHIQMISIPRDSWVHIDGVGNSKINSAAFFGGTKLTVKTVKEFTGLPIKYYVNINFTGFRDVVNAIGGVWINVPYEIDDRQASGWGAKYSHIKKGYQKLNGYYALTFVRARHQFADQDFSRMKNQQMFIKALARQALQLSNVFKAPAIINAVASHMQTNMPSGKMAELVLQFRGLKDEDIETATMPGTVGMEDGQSVVVPDDEALAQLIDKMKKGERFTPKKKTGTSTADASSGPKIRPYTVPLTVRNGAGVSGVGKQAADFLASKGFPIKDTGNMSQFVYGKTLIVYAKGNETKATLVHDMLGFGDMVPKAGMYTFKTPIMVVVGKDWKDPAKESTRRP